MLIELLDRLPRFAAEHPRAVLSVAALATVAAAVLGAGIELRTSTRELVPPGDPAQARWEALQREFHDPEPLILVIEGGSPDDRRLAANRLVDRLRARPDVVQAHYRIELDWLAEHLLWLVPAPDLVAAADALGELAPREGVIEIGALADLLELLAVRLESALEAGDPAARGSEGPARLADAAALLLRLLQDPGAVLAEVPEGPRALVLARSSAADEEGYLRVADGRLVILVTRDGREDGRDGEAAFVEEVRALTAAATAGLPGLAVGLTGPPAMTADEMAAIRDDTRRTSAIAILGVGLLVFVAFHRRRYAVLGLITLAVGVVWALGAVRLELGYLNMITTALVPILVGIGIDYAAHPLSQFELERAAGYPAPEAAARAFGMTSAALTVSALTTAGAFLCFLWMDFRGFSELGLVTGVGVLLCLASSLIVLPALLAWWPRTGRNPRRPAILDRIWGPRQADWLCRWPALVLAIAAAVSVAAALGASQVRLRTGLVDLLPLDAESIRYLEAVAEDPNFSAWVNVVVADDTDDLAAQAALAAAEPSVARFESALTLLPEEPEASAGAIDRLARVANRVRIVDRPWESERLTDAVGRLEKALAGAADAAFGGGELAAAGSLETARADVASVAALLEAAPEELRSVWPGTERALVTRLAAWFDTLRTGAGISAPTLDTLPASVRERLVTRSGRLVGYLHPRDSIFEPAALAEFNRASERVDAEAVGFPVLFERMSGRITSGFAEALVLAAVLVTFLLAVTLRRPGDIVLALSPILLGTLWLVGLMGALGIDFNLANLIAIPLVLGVGIDNGVHLMHRHRLARRAPVATALAQTGRAILIASLTTMIGFGSLALASHRGMASLGLLLLLGVGACMVASVVVLPNLLALRDPVDR